MKQPRAFHDFYAPIDGLAVKFCLSVCGNSGVPKAIFPQEILRGDARKFYEQLETLGTLLDKGLPWHIVLLQKNGNLGAIIEAAEARRAEIYGQLPVAA